MKKSLMIASFLLVLFVIPTIASARASWGFGFSVPLGPPVVSVPPPAYYPYPYGYYGPGSYGPGSYGSGSYGPGYYGYRVWVPGYWGRVWTYGGWARVWRPGHLEYRR